MIKIILRYSLFVIEKKNVTKKIYKNLNFKKTILAKLLILKLNLTLNPLPSLDILLK